VGMEFRHDLYRSLRPTDISGVWQPRVLQQGAGIESRFVTWNRMQDARRSDVLGKRCLLHRAVLPAAPF